MVETMSMKANPHLSADDIVAQYIKAGALLGNKLDYEHKLAFHVILGSILKDVKFPIGGKYEDLRFHLMLVRDSGFGKKLVASLAELLSQMASAIMNSMTYFTTAALIGTLDSEGKQINGLADTSDILLVKESAVVFKTSQTEHSSDILEIFNRILDTPCPQVILKQLAKGAVVCNTSASLFFTTYPFAVLSEQKNVGFFQRVFFSYKRASLSDAEANIDWTIDNLSNDQVEQVKEELRPVVERILELRGWLKLHNKFNFDKVIDALKVSTEIFKSKFRDIADEERAKTFIVRKFNQMLILAMHHAALDLREDVNESDISYAQGLTLNSIQELEAYFEEFSMDVEYNNVKRYLYKLQTKGVESIELTKIFRALHINPTRVLNLLAGEGLIEIVPLKTGGRYIHLVKIKRKLFHE